VSPSGTPRSHPRAMVVTGAMGGGHLAVARELAARLRVRGFDVEVVDLHRCMPRPAARGLEALYPWLVGRAPWLYELIFRRFFLPTQRAGERVGPPVRLALPGLRRLIREQDPQLVISNYHLAAIAVGRLREEGTLDGTALTFLTTFGVHSLWLHPAVDHVVCISEEAAEHVRARVDTPTSVASPAVRSEFRRPASPRDRARLRQAWGIAPDDALALVVAGALGMGHPEATVRAVAAVPGWTVVAVCGNNPPLQRRLERIDGARVLGWTDDMAALMAAADVVVDNAAGLTAKEALAVGVPVLTVAPIAGHGRHDAEAMARAGLTEVVDDPASVGEVLDRVRPGSENHRERVERGRRFMATDIVDVLDDLVAHPVGRGSSPA
jgi:UDP-N-acetylglucosamine:LPS N-acetylglucosamine transferase